MVDYNWLVGSAGELLRSEFAAAWGPRRPARHPQARPRDPVPATGQGELQATGKLYTE